MVTLTNAPIGHNITGVVRAGDPVKYPDDNRLVALQYPYPSDSVSYLSVDPLGNMTSASTIGPSELFQESDPKGFLECERNGPLQFGITYGLF